MDGDPPAGKEQALVYTIYATEPEADRLRQEAVRLEGADAQGVEHCPQLRRCDLDLAARHQRFLFANLRDMDLADLRTHLDLVIDGHETIERFDEWFMPAAWDADEEPVDAVTGALLAWEEGEIDDDELRHELGLVADEIRWLRAPTLTWLR